MGTTSITITNEAYDFLKSIKGKKSFSQTVLSFKKSKHAIMAFAGSMPDLDGKSIEDIRKRINKEWNDRR